MTSNPKPNVRLPTGLQPTTEGELDCFFPQKFPLTAQPVPPHAGRAKPGNSSDRALHKASSYRACNQVLGSAPSLPLEISHYGFSHPPVGVCSSPVGPKALPGVCPSKRLREDCRIALRQAGLPKPRANVFKRLPRSLWVPTSTSSLQFLKPREPFLLTQPPSLASELLDI